jgi:hypothetical protein
LVLKPGCLQTEAISEVLLLLAHAIADGFGCRDMSYPDDTSDLLALVNRLLLQMCKEKLVRWGLWFEVAAMVLLGCPTRPHTDFVGDEGTTIAVIQYGNLAAIASWLDLSQELKVIGCFHLIEGKGRLAVLAQDTHRERDHLQEVQDDYAIITTFFTENVESFVKRSLKLAVPAGTTISTTPDDCVPSGDVSLVATREGVYQLLVRVATKNHSRIINPSDAFSSLLLQVSLKCAHSPATEISMTTPIRTKIFSFDEMLGRWPGQWVDFNQDTDDNAMLISEPLDTHFKYNVAMAIAPNRTRGLMDRCCSECLQEMGSRCLSSGGDQIRYWIRFTPQEQVLAVRGK